jgi:SAM-dependent methyltransferase
MRLYSLIFLLIFHFFTSYAQDSQEAQKVQEKQILVIEKSCDGLGWRLLDVKGENPFAVLDESGIQDCILITHHSFDTVKEHLDLDSLDIFGEQRIISLGESWSELVPELIKQGAQNVYGIDLWYNQFLKQYKDIQEPSPCPPLDPCSYGFVELCAVKAYLEHNKNHLIVADARSLPFLSNSIDVVLNHLFTNNISFQDRKLVFEEILRVLKPGGKARVYTIPREKTLDMESLSSWDEDFSMVVDSAQDDEFKLSVVSKMFIDFGFLLKIEKIPL